MHIVYLSYLHSKAIQHAARIGLTFIYVFVCSWHILRWSHPANLHSHALPLIFNENTVTGKARHLLRWHVNNYSHHAVVANLNSPTENSHSRLLSAASHWIFLTGTVWSMTHIYPIDRFRKMPAVPLPASRRWPCWWSVSATAFHSFAENRFFISFVCVNWDVETYWFYRRRDK